MVSSSSIEKGIASYLDNEFMPKIPLEGIKKIALGAGAGIVIKRSGVMLDYFKGNQMLHAFNIVDDNGNFDIEILRDEIKKQMPDIGLGIEIPLIGTITLKKDDLDVLYNHIIRNA